MIRIAALLLTCCALPAASHQAPTGWHYDPACCSGEDCAVARFGRVRATPEGWRVTVHPGEHPMWPASKTEPLDQLVPYGSHKERRSQDTEFHICIGRTGTLYCLYVPVLGG